MGNPPAGENGDLGAAWGGRGFLGPAAESRGALFT